MTAEVKAQGAFVDASTYIKGNFEPSDRIAILIPNRQTRESLQRIMTAEKASSPEFQAWLRHRSARGDEIYVGMNALKQDPWARTKEQVAAIRHLYVDLDRGGERAIEALRAERVVAIRHTSTYYPQVSHANMVNGLRSKYGKETLAIAGPAPAKPGEDARITEMIWLFDENGNTIGPGPVNNRSPYGCRGVFRRGRGCRGSVSKAS